MKGLILKDLYNTKRYLKSVAIFWLVYAVIGLMMDDPSFLSTVIVIVSIMMVLTSVSLDEAAKFDAYALTLPVTRRDIVTGKYLLILILAVGAAAVSALYTLVMSFFKEFNLGEALATTLGFTVAILIMFSIMLPLIFKFGVEKIRVIMILVFLIPTLAIVLFAQMGAPLPSGEVMNYILYSIPVLSVLSLVISYFISVKIYEKKEF